MHFEEINCILLSPSKEMDLDQQGKNKSLQSFSPITREILTVLRKLSLEELRVLYGLSEEKAALERERLRRIGKEPAIPAYKLYDGIAYRELKKQILTKEQEEYLGKHLVIISAFYGPIQATESIWPYRLDFTMQLKIEGRGLRKLWKEEIEKYFENKKVLNVASQEFSSLLHRKKTEVIDVDFVDEKKKISTYEKKKLRGALAGHLIRCHEISELSLQTFDEGFEYSYENNSVIYKRKA